MLDISWTEFLLIGIVALIVIGPKELPAVLRTLGQWTRKVRSMAAEFQSQFQEAMREAEMADLKKDIDDITTGIKRFDPLKDVRADIEAAGKDIQASLEQQPAVMASTGEPAALTAPAGQDAIRASTGAVVPEAVGDSAPELPAPEPRAAAPEGEIVAAATGPAVPEEAGTAAELDTTGRPG